MANVKIKVNFYDDQQEKLISNNFPNDYPSLKAIDNTVIDVPIEDFKTYSFFKHQCDATGYKTFVDLYPIAQNWDEYKMYLDFNPLDGKILNIYPGDIEGNCISETLGIAGGLSVASHIYGFTQADWTKIPIESHKDFDFRKIAVQGGRFIIIETKGSIVDNNQNKEQAISNHKASIIGKKVDPKFKLKYNYKTDTCIGFITAADKNNELQTWLVDPTFDEISYAPRKIGLLKRLYFYHGFLKFISSRAYITIILSNRIKEVEKIETPDLLNDLPLMNSNFKKISVNESFIDSRAYNSDRSIIGKSIIINSDEIFFVDLDISLFYLIIEQNFNEILKFKNIPKTVSESLACYVPKNDVNMKLLESNPDIEIEREREDNKFIFFQMNTNVIRNSAGLCIAKLNLKEENNHDLV